MDNGQHWIKLKMDEVYYWCLAGLLSGGGVELKT